MAIMAGLSLYGQSTLASEIEPLIIKKATALLRNNLLASAQTATGVYVCALDDSKNYRIIESIRGDARVGQLGNWIRPAADRIVVFEFAPMGDLTTLVQVGLITYEVRGDQIVSAPQIGLRLPDGPLDFPPLAILSLQELRKNLEAQQAGAGQPATAPESKPEGGENPKPESRPAPR